MRHSLLLLSLLISFLSGFAQIGHITTLFIDESRENRAIEVEFYYPSTEDGDDVPLAEGAFPVIVFGHGFVMNYPAYENLWQALVPEGYIMAFPTTETGILPSHSNFGIDLSFIGTQLLIGGSIPESFFYEHINGKMAVMGHSMGGGCSFLAANNPGQVFQTVIGLAPAETNPSAVQASSTLSLPVLVLSGDADNVTPPEDHHLPIYNASGGACKLFVNFIEGSHCYFANSGSLCDLGEFNPGDMDRATQQAHTHELLKQWLDFSLNDSELALQAVVDYVASQSDLDITNECSLVGIEGHLFKEVSIYPNPFSNKLSIESDGKMDEVRILSLNGQELYRRKLSSEHQIDLTLPEDLPFGVLMIELRNSLGSHYQMIVRSH